MAHVELAAIGTTARVTLTDPAAADQARDILARRLDTLDRAASHWRDDSELMLLQRLPRLGATRVSHTLFLDTTAAALWAAEVTDGAVDPTAGLDRPGDWRSVLIDEPSRTLHLVPGTRLDFGATGKALAADRIARDIHRATGAGVLLSLGGDVAVAGSGSWAVGIADDHRASLAAIHQVVEIESGGLATSSTRVRETAAGHHIVDPATGRPVDSPWRTVSVAGSSCLRANTASTAAIVKGAGAVAWLEAQRLPARLVAHDGSVVTTGGWPSQSAVAHCRPEDHPGLRTATPASLSPSRAA